MSITALEVKTASEQAFGPAMNAALQQVFRAADAAILQLAREASDNAGQNRYFEAVQGLRIVKPELIDHFRRRLLAPFTDEVAPEGASVDPEHINSLRKLLGINVESWRADTALAAAEWDFGQRLAAVDSNLGNPLDPVHVVDSFLHSLGEASIDINTKMLMLRMFEGQFYSRLERYVRLANDALAAIGVLPDLLTQPSEAEASLNALVEEVMGQEADADLASAAATLQNALVDLQAGDVENIEKTLDAVTILAVTQKPAVRDIEQELRQQCLLPSMPGQAQQLLLDKMALVGKLFRYLADDNNLPLEARALLVNLQLPYTRIALADAGLLQNNRHPAKLLLNEITEVCAAWQPDRGALESDELFRKLVATVQMFLEAERLESINYRELMFEYLAFAEGQRQKSERATQRLLDSQVGADVADAIRDTVNNIVEKKMAGKKVPDAVQRLLAEGWSNVLYMIALQKGMTAPEWQQALKVVDDLLLTVQPAAAYASRSAFILQLPSLLKHLRKGLYSIDLSTTLINQLLSDLEEAHKKLVCAIAGDFADLEKVADYRPEPEPETVTAEDRQPVPEPLKYAVRTSIAFTPEQLHELALKAVEVVKAGARDIFSARTREIMEKMGPGVSLLWNQPDGQKRCRVAAHIKHANKFIITDRSGAKLAEMSEFDMAQKIDNGEMEIMAGEQLFDRALESVIGNIRDRR